MHTDFSANRREFLRMTGLSAAAVAAGYLPTRPVAGSVRPAARRSKRSKIYIVSDIHIGDNSMTCWYQKRYHEPFLLRILDEVLARRDEVLELILLGDVMDFWTYPPDMRPPTFADISGANPNVFGRTGRLSELCRALEGRVTVLQGNHDMGFSQADWDTIGAPDGPHPRLIGDLYQPMGPQDSRLVVAHGHLYTMFNAPDSSTPFAPLPVGHYVTRSVAHKVRTELAGSGRTAADLADQGAPNGMDIARAFHGIIDDVPGAVGKDHDVVTLLLELARNTCGMRDDQPIILPGGAASSLGDAKTRYAGLWQRWTGAGGGGYSGDALAMRALEADAESKYLGWFAQKLALERNSDLVVMGHTHAPLHGLLCEPSEGRALCNYVNTGFGCRSEPDSRSRSVSYSVIDTDTMQAQAWKVSRSGTDPYTYDLEHDTVPADSIVYRPTMDYSTYVHVDNRRAGAADLSLVSSRAKVGAWVVPPPARIPAGTAAAFWLQDRLGARGSEGSVTYSNGKDSLTLEFECPSGILRNNAKAPRGLKIFARSGRDKEFGKEGDIPRTGHPLIVRFVV